MKLKGTKMKWLLIAGAVIALLFLIDHLYYKQLSGTGKQDLFKKYFTHYPIPSSMDISQNRNSQKEYAFFTYRQKDYNEAIVNFKYALIDYPGDVSITFYLGVSFLATGDADSAIKQFNNTINAGENDYQAPAQWYKALALVREREFNQAREILMEIQNKDFVFQKPSQKLLKEIS